MAPGHTRRLTLRRTDILVGAKLFYIIGASGAGKDSIMRYARDNLPTAASVLFAHRYITRPADAGGENHVALTPDEFARRLQAGCFAMHWRSHGLSYGVGIEIKEWMQRGMHAVVNGSRTYLDKAAALFPNLHPVLIRTDPEILRQRLTARGRETRVEVERRLLLASERDALVDHTRLTCIDNNGSLQRAGQQVIRLLSEDEQ